MVKIPLNDPFRMFLVDLPSFFLVNPMIKSNHWPWHSPCSCSPSVLVLTDVNQSSVLLGRESASCPIVSADPSVTTPPGSENLEQAPLQRQASNTHHHSNSKICVPYVLEYKFNTPEFSHQFPHQSTSSRFRTLHPKVSQYLTVSSLHMHVRMRVCNR